MPPRIIITGGRGRLARLIADHFSRAGGADIRLYSRDPGPGITGGWEHLFRSDAFNAGDTLLHLAWSSLPATAEKQPEAHAAMDLGLLRRLLEVLTMTPITRRPHFVFFSSGGAVYGNAPGRPSREDDACHPVGHYGRTKLAAEDVIRHWGAQRDAAYTILRISNPYGFVVPQERPQGIIPHAIQGALTSSPLTIWGNGSARKDFLHCSDFLAALKLVIARRSQGTFNLCQGESHTVAEVLAEVERQTGRKLTLQHAPAVAWDVHDSRLANDRLRAATGWNPRVHLGEGIRRSLGQNV